MQPSCQNAITQCPVLGAPLTEYNSENPDVFPFIGLSWGPNFSPPLGWSFDNAGCFVAYESEISQSDADKNALEQATQCAQAQWFSPQGVAGNQPISGQGVPTMPVNSDMPSEVYEGHVGGIDEPPII